jgi:hypothetical protein
MRSWFYDMDVENILPMYRAMKTFTDYCYQPRNLLQLQLENGQSAIRFPVLTEMGLHIVRVRFTAKLNVLSLYYCPVLCRIAVPCCYFCCLICWLMKMVQLNIPCR